MSETAEIKIRTEKINGVVLRNLCSKFLDAVLSIYEDPHNQQKFKEWQKRRAQNIA